MLPREDELVMLIQILAALLLVLGSALIIHALVSLDAPSRPRALSHRRFERAAADASGQSLPKAA